MVPNRQMEVKVSSKRNGAIIIDNDVIVYDARINMNMISYRVKLANYPQHSHVIQSIPSE